MISYKKKLHLNFLLAAKKRENKLITSSAEQSQELK